MDLGIINLGIVAHVDAGKTTLTEQILPATGVIRQAGSVDSGSTHTDTMDIERRRGISVKSSSIQTVWKDVEINIIDTPGHMDFISETERALIPLECAVLVVSAVEGVQSQTEIIYNALRNRGIPTIFFINKTDRAGADVRGTAADIEGRLPIRLCDYGDKENTIEKLCECNDMLLARYLETGTAGFMEDEVIRYLQKGFLTHALAPYISGSALKGIGIPPLLDLIACVAPRFNSQLDGQLSGIVYKIEHDKSLGRLAHIKLYGGELRNRDMVHNHSQSIDEKIFQIRKTQGVKTIDTGILRAGELGIVSGLSKARTYDVLGAPSAVLPDTSKISDPLLKARVIPQSESDYPALIAAMEELAVEDPLLHMAWEAETRELIVNITGVIQIEIMRDILLSRFHLDTSFAPPSVIYKETATVAAEGYDAYTMPKPCWAILKFLIEPAERGSGVSFHSIVRAEKIFPAYQAQVRQALPDALRQGPLGWEVTDVRITLVDGEHHLAHTHPLDFIVATPMAIMNGLMQANTTLLEPMYSFRIGVPEELSGKIMNEITLMRGRYDTVQAIKGKAYIEGVYPVATGMYFSVRLASLSNGKGSLSIDFCGYEICPVELGQTAAYRGVNPLDRAKYILSIRHAL